MKDYEQFIRDISEEYLFQSDIDDVEDFIETKDFESYGVSYEKAVFDVTMHILEQEDTIDFSGIAND